MDNASYMRTTRLTLALFLTTLAPSFTKAARADPTSGDGQPAPSPGYALAPSPGYATPLYQQTQPSYVPQSVAMSGPRVIKDWSEGDPVPPGYRPITRIRTGLVAGGAVLFGVTYLFSILGAAIGADDNSGQSNPFSALLVPAAGPFIQMFHSGNSSVGNFFLALDGLSQVGGISMLAIGIAAPQAVLVRNDLASTTPRLSIAPILGPDRSGMGLVGTF